MISDKPKNILVTPNEIVNTSTTSKGNQTKWYLESEGLWVKFTVRYKQLS